MVGALLLWWGAAALPELLGSAQHNWDDEYATTHLSWGDEDRGSYGYARQLATLPPPLLIVRKAVLEIVAKDLDAARAAVERTVGEQGGEIVELTARGEENSARKIYAMARMPAGNLDVAIAKIKLLGFVRHEAHDSKDVRPRLLAAEMRLAEARTQESRLLEALRQHAGKLPEILEVEGKLSELRTEIRNLEAQRTSYLSEVRLAELKVEVEEEYKTPAETPPPTAGRRLRNASVTGYQGLKESAFGLGAFLLGAGPVLLFWIGVFFFPARWAWRRLKASGREN